MSKRTAATQLRLSSAKRRIAAFLEQIDILAESSFPHADGTRVLNEIRAHFAKQVQYLDIPPTAGDEMADQVCVHVARQISEYTAILGLVLRSTNVRNAFELHYLMKQLVEHVLGQPTDLLISSEWDFVPFTYPIGIDLLPEAVLLGSPAPESENPFIVPLAGHEVGHSAWRLNNVEDELNDRVMDAVEEAIAAKMPPSSSAEDDIGGAAGIGVFRDRCAYLALQQLEEIYCDLIGLHLFGLAYLYAFDYLLGPGGSDRALNYPSDAQRMEILVNAAGELGLEVDPGLRESWTEANIEVEDALWLPVIDDAVAALVGDLNTIVRAFMAGLNLEPPAAAGIDKVHAAFALRQPYAGAATLGEIISAGWKMLRAEGDLAQDDDRRTFKVLCDLIWKTIEVAEYLEKGRQPDA